VIEMGYLDAEDQAVEQQFDPGYEEEHVVAEQEEEEVEHLGILVQHHQRLLKDMFFVSSFELGQIKERDEKG
jgi:glycine cleavage system H lipoate-binding protein